MCATAKDESDISLDGNGCCKAHSGVVQSINTLFHRVQETNNWCGELDTEISKKTPTTVFQWIIGLVVVALIAVVGWGFYSNAALGAKLERAIERMVDSNQKTSDAIADLQVQLTKNTATLQYVEKRIDESTK